MSSVPRVWRFMKESINPVAEKCGNCEQTQVKTGRSFCTRCGLVFELDSVEIGDQITISHRVIGKGVRVVFSEPLQQEEKPMLVDLRIRRKEKVEC